MEKKTVKRRKAVKKENSKRVIKSEIEIIMTEDKKHKKSFEENSIGTSFSGDSELTEFVIPSGKTPVLGRISRVPQQQGFRLEKWAEETPATNGESEEDGGGSAKYSLPKTGVTYVESQHEIINPTQVDLMKIGREERNFGQQTTFTQSSEARMENNPLVERYETAERFDRDKMKKEENDFGVRKVRYDAKFSGR